MPRIDYVPADISEPAELVAAIRARRGGRLLNLDRMLMHSPALARGWNVYMGAVRTQLSVSPRLREIGICVVAVLNEAEYEFMHHAPELLAAGGSQAQVDALRDPGAAADNPALFDEAERATIALTLDMTRSVRVSEGRVEALAAQIGAQATVELVAAIAAYNMVSRLLVALGVEPEAD